MGSETAMTKALQDAFNEAEKLPEAERAWEAPLAASQDALGALADEALAEHRSGRTLRFDPDEQ